MLVAVVVDDLTGDEAGLVSGQEGDQGAVPAASPIRPSMNEAPSCARRSLVSWASRPVAELPRRDRVDRDPG